LSILIFEPWCEQKPSGTSGSSCINAANKAAAAVPMRWEQKQPVVDGTVVLEMASC
jgi:hypothetical protein